MKRKSVSLKLFDGEDLDRPLPNVFPMKKKKPVSLSLFNDLLLRNQVQNEQEPRPEPLLPEILREIGLNGGTEPIFLYQKRLTSSDTKPDQNRIFLSNNREKVMGFLTEVERQLVEVNQGSVKILTIDPKGKYYMLHMKRWDALKMVVLKKEWSKLVEANKLEEGDWIQLWGYRQNSQFHLAFNIKKAATKATHHDAAISSCGCGPSIVSKV